MLKNTMMIASALTGLAMLVPTASAQSGSYWSYDGQKTYSSYQACEDARTTRTIGRTAIGGAVGAGLGTLAGGDDTRNAVIGGIVGAIAGGASSNNKSQCYQYQTSAYSGGYSEYSQKTVRYENSTPYSYGHNTGYSSGYGSNTVYSSGYGSNTVYSSQPTYTYQSSTPGYTYSGQGGHTYTRTTTKTYQEPYSGHHQTYSHQPYSGQKTTTYTRTYQGQPQYGSTNYGYQTNAGYNSGYTNSSYWSYDGQTRYQSYESCEQAKRQRTLAGGGLGALAGAGLGTLAGGDDGRNAAIGAVAGAVVGAYSGNRSVQCTQYTVSSYR